jgi:iron complex outermembrane receptor protein
VRDLIWLLDNDPGRLKGSEIADKVIGKAAAALAVVGEVRRLYAAVLSERAVPFLDTYGIGYTFGELVPKIVIPEGDDRCPLEEIVLDAATPSEAEALLREHFRKMQERSQNTK